MTMTMQEYLTRQEQRSTTQTTDAKINYFNSLKSSGQTAIVRFTLIKRQMMLSLHLRILPIKVVSFLVE